MNRAFFHQLPGAARRGPASPGKCFRVDSQIARNRSFLLFPVTPCHRSLRHRTLRVLAPLTFSHLLVLVSTPRNANSRRKSSWNEARCRRKGRLSGSLRVYLAERKRFHVLVRSESWSRLSRTSNEISFDPLVNSVDEFARDLARVTKKKREDEILEGKISGGEEFPGRVFHGYFDHLIRALELGQSTQHFFLLDARLVNLRSLPPSFPALTNFVLLTPIFFPDTSEQACRLCPITPRDYGTSGEKYFTFPPRSASVLRLPFDSFLSVLLVRRGIASAFRIFKSRSGIPPLRALISLRSRAFSSSITRALVIKNPQFFYFCPPRADAKKKSKPAPFAIFQCKFANVLVIRSILEST